MDDFDFHKTNLFNEVIKNKIENLLQGDSVALVKLSKLDIEAKSKMKDIMLDDFIIRYRAIIEALGLDDLYKEDKQKQNRQNKDQGLDNPIENEETGLIEDSLEDVEIRLNSENENKQNDRNKPGILRGNVLEAVARREKGLAHELVVKEIKANKRIYALRNDLKRELWIYIDGIYVPQGESYIKEFCRNILGEAYSGQFFNEVASKLEADTFIDEQEFFSNSQKNIKELAVKNGILDLTTNTLADFTPDKIFFNKLPVLFSPGAKCPNIIKHFGAVLKSDADIQVMQELVGALLWKENFSEMAFMFAGDTAGMDGRNGKSKTLMLFQKFLGAENCSAISIQQLDQDQYSYSGLVNKMANLAGDISPRALKNSSKFKMSVGRDPYSAQRKNRELLTFVNYAKHIFAANKLPATDDNSVGFWSKWVLFTFPYMFVSKEDYDAASDKTMYRVKDPDIIQKIATDEELSGLLNWGIEGLNRLKDNKGIFSNSPAITDLRNEWIRKSDSFAAFLMDDIQEEWDGKITKAELRRGYSIYCKKHKLKMSTDKLMKDLLCSTYSVSDERDQSVGKQVTYWSGITFKKSKGSMDSNGFSITLGNGNSLDTTKKHTNHTDHTFLTQFEPKPNDTLNKAYRILKDTIESDTKEPISLEDYKKQRFTTLTDEEYDKIIKFALKKNRIFEPKPGFIKAL